MLSFGNLTHWYEWCLLVLTLAQLTRVYIIAHRQDAQAREFEHFSLAIPLALLLYCMMP